AMRFVQLPLGVFGVALASAMLPSVARNAAEKNFNEFRKTLSRSLALMLLLTIPSSVALILLGRPIIGVIFESGRFEPYDTRQTALALACYSLGLLGYASVKILNPAFYALGDARTPMYASLLSIGVNICVPIFLLDYLHFGFASLALTTAVAVTLEALLLFECLRRKLGGIEGRYLADRFVRVTIASVFMGASIVWLNHAIGDQIASGRAAYLNQLAVSIPLAALVFFVTSHLVGLNEIRFATGLFIAPLRKSLLVTHARIRS
ncbi:MAG: polysaccharide biosynthesis C-terminal domain-containing protein, partial [Acidobacteriaceae bacterium]|nr:polysaccharide biosynthesis C-terminal domain-containing protein [Acidobacteriaceae bacterium]